MKVHACFGGINSLFHTEKDQPHALRVLWGTVHLDGHMVETRHDEPGPLEVGDSLRICSSWISLSKRYKYCGEGCCPHEFCAYHKICYPVIHCDPTCPDGSCLNGLCFPAKPCKQNMECGFAETCTYHYNLGYDTCQYNLNIGDTLCYDRKGNAVFNPKPDESPFEHDIFKNKQNNL
uniref:Uncharacterized protein LOC111118254 n=1 Tax=Crassostrea virginica TaxID=6565 RepID=A0A8B8CC30_CRAVI|nr:uncharacterized protein LOC111118254 [Crassostrea virginica]